MRDSYKDIEHFNNLINSNLRSISLFESKLNSNSVKEDRIRPVKHSLSLRYYEIIKCMYSRGDNMFSKEVKSLYKKTLLIINDYWIENNVNVLKYKDNGNIIALTQYYKHSFFEFLDIISLGYLLDIPSKTFSLIVDFIDKDNVKDFLYEFIICEKLQNRQPLIKDNFKEFDWYKYPVDELRDIIKMDNKEEAQLHLKHFLNKVWYKAINGTKGYNTHNKPNSNYQGYWCFVAAVIVKIKRLDDSSFRDNKYYPKDL